MSRTTGAIGIDGQPHRTRAEQAMGVILRAACSCGWQGEARDWNEQGKTQVRQDADSHTWKMRVTR